MPTYFLQRLSTGRIKIGHTSRPVAERIRDIQSDFDDDLVHIATSIIPERDLHRRFNSLRVHREWFLPGPKLVAFIQNETTVHAPIANPVPVPMLQLLGALRHDETKGAAGQVECDWVLPLDELHADLARCLLLELLDNSESSRYECAEDCECEWCMWRNCVDAIIDGESRRDISRIGVVKHRGQILFRFRTPSGVASQKRLLKFIEFFGITSDDVGFDSFAIWPSEHVSGFNECSLQALGFWMFTQRQRYYREIPKKCAEFMEAHEIPVSRFLVKTGRPS